MKPGNWREVAELIGIAAIVASLIFVGLELQQSQEIAISEAYQARAAIEVEHAFATAAVPEYVSAMAKIYDGGTAGDLTTAEYVVLEHYIAAQLGIWENDHFQVQRGYLSEEHWDKTYKNMLCDLALPVYRELAGGWSFRESFTSVVTQALREAQDDPLDCWPDAKER